MSISKHLILFFTIFSISSCENYFGDINRNPNSPISASLQTVLIAAEVEMADWYGGEMTRITSMLTQQTEGVARVNSFYTYGGIAPVNFATMWTNNYANILTELKYIKEQANTQEFDHMEAVANILMAFQLIQATDVWNEIPWTEALQGLDILTPIYDSQASIYNIAEGLLSEAEVLLNGENGGFAITGDIIYNGDVEKWKKLVLALQARSALHWSLQNPQNYAKALAAAQNSFTSPDDEMKLPFPGTSGNENPMFRFFRDRTGDIEFNPVFRQILEALNDTMRIEVLNHNFDQDHPYFTADYAQPMLTYREIKFIEAECLLETNGSPADVEAAYLEGIRASFEDFGVESAYIDYIQQNTVSPGMGNITLEHIMLQKYIALYAVPEVYNDWRRTDIPTLQPTSGDKIPVRFPYSETEISLNPNTPNIDVFLNKVAWDLN